MMIEFDILWPKWGINPTGVLHIGASTGQEAEVYYNHGVKDVIWIEGNGEVFKRLQDHVKDIPGSICIHACVSDRDGEAYFNISNNDSQSSSILELGHHSIIHPEVHYVDKMPVKTHRVDELLKDFKIEGDWFLNIDLQGAELLALKGMGEMVNKFKWAYLEVNLKETYIGCPLIGEIDEYLKQYGFERVETGQLVAETWTDALYIKK
jgi:FkbM family methyltransferase